MWFPDGEKKGLMGERAYRDMLVDVAGRVKNEIRGLSFNARHPYWKPPGAAGPQAP